ncbi:Dam family site-specific DNA-(adenine-N6)-methyltransferase [uncultured Treponema sp.]|uniref:Dam family site-specific DNA-(adenine-N6)-methyltransferase n=1 Tax=uncultured Treponema sp. TaxID=162155 RepID=UPI0015BF2D29|nr:Dam family site-specific DNA-(adenine-N6)-methyltransferase [uncultured Treponema sp.]
MRYIGSKANLLRNIEDCISTNIHTKQKSFCDIFSGTGIVARYFKPQYEIVSNDALFFSYIIQKSLVENNETPAFSKLHATITDPFDYLENASLSNVNNFVEENYSPSGKAGRMYFTSENARRIDFIRTTIEQWKIEKKLTEAEYYYLLTSLIVAVPSVSNITGTYGAYLKHWDKRAYKKIELPHFDVQNNNRNNKAYNENVFDLEKHISGDILYIDPPYNSRQYASNYHVLETIARYDNPELTGVTGMRPYANQKSVFCSKYEVNDAFEHLIRNADFTHIVLSYSSAGLMKSSFIEKTLKDNGIASTYSLQKIPYRKYKSKIYDESDVCEYLFYIQKKAQNNIYILPDEKTLAVASPSLSYSLNTQKQKYIKSPLNYIGGKYKLLPQLMPLLPKNINTFVDLFCGGGNVGVNADCKKLIFNDMNTILMEMFKTFSSMELDDLLNQIDGRIKKWNLSITNENAFITFREHYNKTRNPIDLYVLSCFSFNYQFRFNNNHEYNNPFGRNRSRYSDKMKANLIQFVQKVQSASADFVSHDFTEFPIDNLTENDFVYCDPPYLITTGSYNDGNRGFKNWTKESDKALYTLLDILNKKGIRFALSNVFTHKGERNDILIEWAKKYIVHHLQKDYSNSSYNTERSGSDEVLVTNYVLENEK